MPIDSIDSGTLYFYTGDTVVFKLVEQTEWTLHGLKMKGNLWSLKNYDKQSVFKYKSNHKEQIFYIPKPFEKNAMTKTEMAHYISGKKQLIMNIKQRVNF